MWPIWISSIFVRYCLLFPVRFCIFFTSSLLTLTVLVPLAWISPPASPVVETLMHIYMRAVLVGLGLHVHYHGKKPKLNQAHIFVANHTSVTDYAVASGQGRAHAVVAQAHGGVFGWMSRHVLRPLTASLLFDRNENRDRVIVAKRMKEHVANLMANPLLIFPEGTCVNNEYTILFHKGAFELDCAVCPVAIKYSKRFGDPYFNTRVQTFTAHLFYLMTRWVNKVDVYWVPPVKRETNETSVDFTNRVKALISEKAGLKNLSWDGYLKNYRPNSEKQAKMRSKTRQDYQLELKSKLALWSNYQPSEQDEKSPSLPARDYFPDWLSEESRTDIQNEIMQRKCDSMNCEL